MTFNKLLLSIILLTSISYANTCPKWLPMSNGDIIAVIPIYNPAITGPDMDCDEILDNVDRDIDGDGVPNTSDAFPRNGSESVDTDGDGIGNNADNDDDNDGLSDAEEITKGTNPLNADTDGDGVNDKDDYYPTDASQSEAPKILQAQDDLVHKTVIEETTINVLGNDTHPNGVTPVIRIESPSMVSRYKNQHTEENEGRWSIENNQIIFTPSSNCSGGSIHRTYQLSDGMGNAKIAQITIEFPIRLQAQDDNVTKATIESTSINVLANDTLLEGATPTVLVGRPSSYSTFYENYANNTDGNWSVEGNQVVFTPGADFSGGTASINYELSDGLGHIQEAKVTIEYPILLQAQDDNVTIPAIEETTINVLANDTLLPNTTPTIMLGDPWSTPSTQYQDYYDNNWTVVDNQVVFTPSPSFNGSRGYAHAPYILSDGMGHTQSAEIRVFFPALLSAVHDRIFRNTIEPVTVDVLANDIISDGSAGTILLSGDSTSIERGDGNWTIVNNKITFTPKAYFSGGTAFMFYKLSDASGYTDQGLVAIDYPYILQAASDHITKDTIEETTVDVLANDTLQDGATPTILLRKDWREEFINDHLEVDDGNWTVDSNNKIRFTPKENISIGMTYIDYQLSDGLGYHSVGQIVIDFDN